MTFDANPASLCTGASTTITISGSPALGVGVSTFLDGNPITLTAELSEGGIPCDPVDPNAIKWVNSQPGYSFAVDANSGLEIDFGTTVRFYQSTGVIEPEAVCAGLETVALWDDTKSNVWVICRTSTGAPCEQAVVGASCPTPTTWPPS